MKNLIKKHKNLLRFSSFLLIFAVAFSLASGLFCTADRRDLLHVRGFFYEPKNSLDVVLIGPSELYTGFNSPLAWRDYGFTSYSLSYAAVRGSMYQPMLRAALQTQSPKLVVVEINGMLYRDEVMNDNTNIMLTWYMNEPFSKGKYDSIRQNVPQKDRTVFYWNFFKFHNNWRHPINSCQGFLGKVRMDMEGISYTKSFCTQTSKRNKESFRDFQPYFTENNRKIFTEFLEYCKSEGLENILFVRGPHCVNNKNPKLYDEIQKLINEYGYDFLNLENEFKGLGLDVKEDFYNDDHMNVYGMEKYTDYLGKYITENYDVKSEHSAKEIETWNLCVKKTEAVIVKCKHSMDEGEVRGYWEIDAYKV